MALKDIKQESKTYKMHYVIQHHSMSIILIKIKVLVIRSKLIFKHIRKLIVQHSLYLTNKVFN